MRIRRALLFAPSQYFPLGGLSFSSHFNEHGEALAHLDTPLRLFFHFHTSARQRLMTLAECSQVQTTRHGPAVGKTTTSVTFRSIVSDEAAISGISTLQHSSFRPLSKNAYFLYFFRGEGNGKALEFPAFDLRHQPGTQ